MLGNVGRRVVRNPLGRAAIGGALGGPLGAVAGVASRPLARGAQAARRGARATSARTTAAYNNAASRPFLQNHPRMSKVAGFASRRPILTGLGAYGVGSAYNRLPGANRSNRNQNDPYLRRVRDHQRSSSVANFMSSGGGTGSYA